MSKLTSSPTNIMKVNQTNITSQSEVVAIYKHETRNRIQSRSPDEWRRSLGLQKLRGAMVKDITLAHIYTEKLFKKQQSFVHHS